MATYAELAAKVWKALGKASAGQADQDVYDVFKDLLDQDIASRLGGIDIEGSVSLPVGDTDYVSTGIYPLPVTLRTLEGPIFQDDVLLDWTTDPDVFWHEWNLSSTDEGKPSSALVRGRKITLRAIPPATAPGNTLVLFGKLYIDNTVIAAGSPAVLGFEGVLVAGAITLLAAAQERTEVLQVWDSLFKGRLDALRGDVSAWRRSAHNPAQF